MLPFEEALTTRLLANVAIAALVNDDIYWVERKEGTGHPSIVLTIVADIPEYNHDSRDNLQEMRVQVDSRALSPIQTRQLDRLITTELEAPADVGTVRFHEGRKVSGFDAKVDITKGDTSIYRYASDFIIQFQAAP